MGNSSQNYLGSAGSAPGPLYIEFPEKHVLEGLRELGWIDGKTVTIDFPSAAGDCGRLAQLAADLVRLKIRRHCDIQLWGRHRKDSTGTIPVVFGTSQEPVRAGFVPSLAQPANLTGVSFLTDDLSGTRLELLKDAMPSLTRAAVLWEPADVENEFKGMQAAAPALKLKLQSVEIPRPTPPDEVERAIHSARDGNAQAIILAPADSRFSTGNDLSSSPPSIVFP